MTPIREVRDLSPATFRNELVERYEPVVIRGAAAGWPLVAAGSSPGSASAYLRQFDRGSTAEAFVGQPEIRGRYFYTPDMRGFNFERRKGPLAALLATLEQVHDSDAPPSIYAGALDADATLPGLSVANPMPLVEGLDATPRLWIGNASIVSIHFDASDNVAVVAGGRRRFTLFPPDQVPNLYVGPLDHNMAGQPASMVELNDPDFDR